MMLATGIMGVASIGYLIKKTDGWDRVSDAAVELAIVFGVMVLISGPLWGRKAWGVYWVWDVRLTSTLILVLTLIACKIVRSYAGAASKQISAGLAIFALLDTVFVYFCVMFWRTTHPQQVTTGGGKLDPLMRETLFFCAFTFLVIGACMLWARLRMGRLRTGLDRLYMRATEAGLND
jgi:heme exporter protein C